MILGNHQAKGFIYEIVANYRLFIALTFKTRGLRQEVYEKLCFKWIVTMGLLTLVTGDPSDLWVVTHFNGLRL